jgi:citrate synthase
MCSSIPMSAPACCWRLQVGIRVPGIGHRIKSKDNRDKRVELLQDYARKVRG